MGKNILNAIIYAVIASIFMFVSVLYFVNNLQDTLYLTGGLLQLFGVLMVLWGLILIYCDVKEVERPSKYVNRLWNRLLVKLKIKKEVRGGVFYPQVVVR